ncbi:MAG: hypothetical protein AAF495_24500 [Pseudomonadota bacterium]
MTQADIFVRMIAAELKESERAIAEHPFLLAFRDGRAAVGALVPFVGTQYAILNALAPASAARLAAPDCTLPDGVLRGLLSGKLESRDKLPVMAANLGLSVADLEAYEPSARSFAFGAYLTLLLRQGTPAEVAAAFLVNLPLWGRSCGTLARALREIYAWPGEATAFLDGYAGLPPIDREALPAIQAGLDRGEDPRRIARAARLVQEYERAFWNALVSEAADSLSATSPALRLSA